MNCCILVIVSVRSQKNGKRLPFSTTSSYGQVIYTGVLHVLDWCVVCTGLVYCMYWTGVLVWCIISSGQVCFMYWTGVFIRI